MSEEKDKKEVKIDISNISNLNANTDNAAVKDFISNNVKKEEKTTLVKDLPENHKRYELEVFEKYPRKFEFVQPEKIELPSKGIPYQDCEDKDVKSGYVWLYPITMKEEEILSTPKYIMEGTATIKVLNNCLKSNISAMDLTIGDYYYLLLCLRKISISDKFEFDIACSHCGHKFTRTLKMDDIKYDDFDKTAFEEPKRIDLDKIKYTVVIGIPRIKHIRELSFLYNEYSYEVGVADLLAARTYAIIDNKGNELNKNDYASFYNNLPTDTFKYLNKEAETENYLNHYIGECKCPKCGETVEGSNIDLNNDALFRVSSEQSE